MQLLTNSGVHCFPLDAEIERQISCYESHILVAQETRGFDVSTRKTFRIRSKESAPDYRYMPEPDLPRLVLSPETIQALRIGLPELPDARRKRMMEKYQLGMIETRTLMGEEHMVEYFESVVSSGRQVKSAISWITHELLGRLHTRGIEFSPDVVTTSQLGSLIDCVDQGQISSKIGKAVLDMMIGGDSRDANAIVEEKGWKQMNNQEELDTMCDDILAKYPEKVTVIQKGNMGVLGFLVGQVLKQSQGRANPGMVNELLRTKIGLPKDPAEKQGKKT